MQTSHRKRHKPRALVIAASTGGPQVVQDICKRIGSACSEIPLFIVVHLPDGYAETFAAQLQRASGLPTMASRESTPVQAGHIYVAASGVHLTLARTGPDIRLHHDFAEPVNFCRPAADVLFSSAASIYGPDITAIVLSGMGSDGLNGCRAIARAGGQILVQDEASSAVWGMPGAIARSEIDCVILPPDDIAHRVRISMQAPPQYRSQIPLQDLPKSVLEENWQGMAVSRERAT
jgi:two-component system, chemotaxis family, protein-glutamate methylesterase/glutaminase